MPTDIVITARVSPGLVARLDALCASAPSSLARVRRSDIIRAAIEEGMAVLESRFTPSPEKAPT